MGIRVFSGVHFLEVLAYLLPLCNEDTSPVTPSSDISGYANSSIRSATWEEHLSHLRLVFKTLLDNQLVAKLSKCVFGQTQVGYLGHIVSAEGIAVDPEKIVSIQNWPTPKNVKDV
ncbi:putative nucleotidyltransferase, Ribonuclease H [Helianthus anomalus]